VGTTGPMGSGLPQFGFPLRFAIWFLVPQKGLNWFQRLRTLAGDPLCPEGESMFPILGIFSSKINSK
jgi:hypothetical protein